MIEVTYNNEVAPLIYKQRKRLKIEQQNTAYYHSRVPRMLVSSILERAKECLRNVVRLITDWYLWSGFDCVYRMIISAWVWDGA